MADLGGSAGQPGEGPMLPSVSDADVLHLQTNSGEGVLDVSFLDNLADEMDTWQLDTLDGLDNAGFLDPGSGAAGGFEAPDVPLPEVPSVAPQRAAVPTSAFSSQPDGLSDAGYAQRPQQLGPPGQAPQSSALQAVPGTAWADMPPLPPPSVRAASGAPMGGGAGFRTDAGDLASLRHEEYRPKIESWERRSSEPAYLTPGSPDGDRSSPSGGRPASSPQHTRHGVEHGRLPLRGLAVDKSAGIQRRRSLRRGGSARGTHHDSECRLADLSVQLERALSANAMLEGRNQLLEQFVGLQAKYTAPGGPPPPVHTDTWWLDAVTRQMVEQRLNLSGMLTFTLRGGRPINLTREQVAALSWLEFCKLWKDYMAALRDGLAEVSAFAAAHPGVECPAAKRLARLVYETGILRGCLQTASPNRHAALLCFLPDGEPRPPLPDATAWRAVAAALNVTQHQRAQLAQLRVMYLRVLGRMARQRRDMVATLQAAIPVADGGDVGAAGYEAALDGLEALRVVLRDEHSLLTQYKMIVWGRVFTPVQAAIATTAAYPWAADLPAIVNCVADDLGEPSCAALLAGQA